MISPRSFFSAAVLAWLMILPAGLRAQASRPEPIGLRSDSPIYAKHGPYWVGTKEFVIKTGLEERSLPATLWYPAQNPDGRKDANTFLFYDAYTKQKLSIPGHALVDAPPEPAGAPYPLVIFSHGDDNSRLLSVFLQEHAASYGVAVLGVDHPRPDEERLMDIVRAADFAGAMAAEPGPFQGLIDVSRIAVVGHSAGALDALKAGGFFHGGRGLQDARIRAVVAMAMSAEVDSFDFTKATTPTLLLAGSLDSQAKTRSAAIYKALPAERKGLAILLGATHGSPFLDPVVVLRPGTLALDRADDLVNHFTTAFLLDVLKGDKEAHMALLPEAVKFEEVQYTTTWK